MKDKMNIIYLKVISIIKSNDFIDYNSTLITERYLNLYRMIKDMIKINQNKKFLLSLINGFRRIMDHRKQ